MSLSGAERPMFGQVTVTGDDSHAVHSACSIQRPDWFNQWSVSCVQLPVRFSLQAAACLCSAVSFVQRGLIWTLWHVALLSWLVLGQLPGSQSRARWKWPLIFISEFHKDSGVECWVECVAWRCSGKARHVTAQHSGWSHGRSRFCDTLCCIVELQSEEKGFQTLFWANSLNISSVFLFILSSDLTDDSIHAVFISWWPLIVKSC